MTPAAIDSARQEAAAAATLAGEARAEDDAAARAELEQTIAALKLQIRVAADSSAERSALEQRLSELELGSGRSPRAGGERR